MNTTRDIAMTNRLRQLRPRDAVLFVVFAAVVAVVVVVIGRELGLGGRTAAVRESDSAQSAAERADSDLSLTLARQRTVCETSQNTWEQMGNYARLNDDGEVETGIISHGFRARNFMPVDWKISGGTPPYELVIDGMDRNWDGEAFAGTEGNAWVDCLWPTSPAEYFGSGPARYTRRYRSEPQLDSGWKTFSAQVTDANGNVAKAQAEFYILTAVWSNGHIITPGETYRLKSTFEGPGFTFTAPSDIPMRIGDYAISEGSDGCSEFVALRVGDPRVAATLWLCSDTGEGDTRHLPDGSEAVDGEGASSFYAEHPLNQALSDIVESINAYPAGTTE